MSTGTKETRTLKIDTPVVVRKVPQSKKGCSTLRAIRDYQVEQYYKVHGNDIEIEIPFPTSIHLALEDYARVKNIEVDQED